MFKIYDKNGTEIYSFRTYREADSVLHELEQEDREDGFYQPGYYCIREVAC